jgi:hypothetical protein
VGSTFARSSFNITSACQNPLSCIGIILLSGRSSSVDGARLDEVVQATLRNGTINLPTLQAADT